MCITSQTVQLFVPAVPCTLDVQWKLSPSLFLNLVGEYIAFYKVYPLSVGLSLFVPCSISLQTNGEILNYSLIINSSDCLWFHNNRDLSLMKWRQFGQCYGEQTKSWCKKSHIKRWGMNDADALHCLSVQVWCSKCWCKCSDSSSKHHVERSWVMDLREGWRVGIFMHLVLDSLRQY